MDNENTPRPGPRRHRSHGWDQAGLGRGAPRPSLRSATIPALAGGATLLLGLAGCLNPFAPDPSDYGRRVSEDRFRNLERLRLEDYARPAAPFPAHDEAEATVRKRFDRDRFKGLERLAITIEQARASALAHNLQVSVALQDPRIAGQTLRAEEAKFEAVFTPAIRYREQDAPTLDITAPNQQDTLSLDAGVSIPMRTGGRVRVGLSESKSDTPNNPFVTLPTSYSSALTFSISQPLLRNAGRDASVHSIKIASYEEQAVMAQTRLEVIRQLAAVDRAYWRLDAVRRELEVRQTQYELAVALLEKARRRVRSGAAPEIEEIRAESGVAERLEAIITAENALLTQQRELKRIINMPGLAVDTPTIIEPATTPDPVPYAFDPAALCDAAVANRMEMLELELRLAADAATIDFNRNEALPLFVLDYTYSVDGLGPTWHDNNQSLRKNNFESWTLGLSGEVPIGNEAAKARVQRAILVRLQRLGTRDAREQAIRQEVLNAVDTINADWQRILAARLATVAAARTYEAEQRQNDAGARTATDVLDAQSRLAEAQSAEIRAIAEYQIALVDLAFATGTLLGAARIDFGEPLHPDALRAAEHAPPRDRPDHAEIGLLPARPPPPSVPTASDSPPSDPPTPAPPPPAPAAGGSGPSQAPRPGP
jgi:outer membrane protein TolC